MKRSRTFRVAALALVCVGTVAMGSARTDSAVESGLQETIKGLVAFDNEPLDRILDFLAGRTGGRVAFVASSLALWPQGRAVTVRLQLRSPTLHEVIEHVAFTCELSYKASRLKSGQVAVAFRRAPSRAAAVTQALRELIRAEIRTAASAAP